MMSKENVVDTGQSTTSASSTTGCRAREKSNHKWSHKGMHVSIVDIKPLTRNWLANLLGDLVPEWRIASYSHLHEMTKCGRSNRAFTPTLVILVYSRPADDLYSVKRDIATLKESLPFVPVVILSNSDDAWLVATSLCLGASGVITTSLDPQIIIRALVLVAVGGTYIPPGAIAGLMKQHQRQSEGHRLESIPHLNGVTEGPRATFTPRQRDVLRLLRQGLSNKTIAHVLQLQECSVKAHVRQLMHKLGARNRTQIACHAVEILGKDILDGGMLSMLQPASDISNPSNPPL